jgi:hypothetical protein
MQHHDYESTQFSLNAHSLYNYVDSTGSLSEKLQHRHWLLGSTRAGSHRMARSTKEWRCLMWTESPVVSAVEARGADMQRREHTHHKTPLCVILSRLQQVFPGRHSLIRIYTKTTLGHCRMWSAILILRFEGRTTFWQPSWKKTTF